MDSLTTFEHYGSGSLTDGNHFAPLDSYHAGTNSVGSASVVAVDPEIRQPITHYYTEQSRALEQVSEHLGSYCNLNGSFGFVLAAMVKPKYTSARQRVQGALSTSRDVVDSLCTQFNETMTDLENAEASYQDEIDSLQDGLDCCCDDTNPHGSGGYGGGYGSGGGYGGSGGFGGPSSWAPSDPGASADSHVNVSVHVDSDGDVDVDVDVDGNSSAVDIDVEVESSGAGHTDVSDPDDDAGNEAVTPEPADASDATATTPATSGHGSAPVAEASAAPEKDLDSNTLDGVLPEPTSSLSAEQLAQRATYYDQIWQEQAASDPLGRSADELRLAWENREQIELDESLLAGAHTIGYGDTTSLSDVPADLGLLPGANGASA